MKNFIIGFLLCLVLVCGTAAVSMYQKWGPIQMKAVIAEIVEEFNRNRDWHGRPHVTAEQVRDAVYARMDVLETNLQTDVDLKWIVEQRP